MVSSAGAPDRAVECRARSSLIAYQPCPSANLELGVFFSTSDLDDFTNCKKPSPHILSVGINCLLCCVEKKPEATFGHRGRACCPWLAGDVCCGQRVGSYSVISVPFTANLGSHDACAPLLHKVESLPSTNLKLLRICVGRCNGNMTAPKGN